MQRLLLKIHTDIMVVVKMRQLVWIHTPINIIGLLTKVMIPGTDYQVIKLIYIHKYHGN